MKRRDLLKGIFGVAGVGALSACAPSRIYYYDGIVSGHDGYPQMAGGNGHSMPTPPENIGGMPDYEPLVVNNNPTPTSRYVAYRGVEPAGTILINRDARRLYFIEGAGRAIEYPIAVGREGTGRLDSVYHVFRKAANPTWTPTPSMRAKNPSLPVRVAGGIPQNPLGTRAIYLARSNGADSLLRIHGTNAPSSIGSAASSGCFRMHNHDVEDLFPRVQTGARVMAFEGRGLVPGVAFDGLSPS